MKKPSKGDLILIGLGGKPKPEEEKSEREDDSEESMSAETAAAQALLDAVQDGDAEALLEAFKTLKEVC